MSRQHTVTPVIRLNADFQCRKCGTLLIQGDRVKAYASGIYGMDCHNRKGKLTPAVLQTARLHIE